MVFACKPSIYFSLFSVLQWRHLWGLSAQKRNTVTPPSLKTSYPNSQAPGCFPPLYSTSRPLCLWPAALVWIPSRAAVVRMAGVPSVSALQRTLVDPKVQLTHLLELPGRIFGMGSVYTYQLESSIQWHVPAVPSRPTLGAIRQSMEAKGNTLFFRGRPFRCVNIFLRHPRAEKGMSHLAHINPETPPSDAVTAYGSTTCFLTQDSFPA